MAAYMIVFAQVKDRQRFLSEYAAPAAALVARSGGEYVLRAPGVESLEGGLFGGASAVISRWPDMKAIRVFWECPEYQALKAARQSLAEAHVMVVEAPE